MKALYGSVLVFVLFLLVGCGGGESLEKKLVGSWKVDTAKTEIAPTDAKDEAEKKMAMAMLSAMSLELKEDKKFTLNFIFPVDGTWALSGNKLTLSPTKKEGESMKFMGKDTIDFDVEGDGTTLSATSTDPKMPGKLVMTKSEAAK